MGQYRTAQVAEILGIHPNTVRFYEEWGLISRPRREENGYRVFTDLHIRQIRLARTAFQIEVVQNGLRKKIIAAVKAAAAGDLEGAMLLAGEYLEQLQRERANAEEAIRLSEEILAGRARENRLSLRRKEAAAYLGVSVDALRNWERNGLLSVKRKENGYRVYTDEDIDRLKIIRALRCANYSLEAILRMLRRLSQDPRADIGEALNTPEQRADIVSVCDKLIVSLSAAESNAHKILEMLRGLRS